MSIAQFAGLATWLEITQVDKKYHHLNIYKKNLKKYYLEFF
jgi:hypothetical protein